MEENPIENEKYVRLPYYRVTLENAEVYVEKSQKMPTASRASGQTETEQTETE